MQLIEDHSSGGHTPMRVNLGRKSWSEQQLARAWATSAVVLARQPAQPRGQSLQHAEQLAEVL